jgi:hypothetical protein
MNATTSNRILSTAELKENSAVEVSQQELINLRQHAWQNGIQIKVKQTFEGAIVKAPTMYLMITGFLDDESKLTTL